MKMRESIAESVAAYEELHGCRPALLYITNEAWHRLKVEVGGIWVWPPAYRGLKAVRLDSEPGLIFGVCSDWDDIYWNMWTDGEVM